jgi:hypothetical protein
MVHPSYPDKSSQAEEAGKLTNANRKLYNSKLPMAQYSKRSERGLLKVMFFVVGVAL